ncbi:PIN domain-containing protein [candidate division KSB1 bacterium]|nr:MAG: PIN domain-containing protein [candidate division KSB1 bacterium]MCE7944209.1 PIN domain-containing protein [Chlorobi bacterium CHB1]MDL1877037.1 type II toxin-antitoxin system VapC family toxin [Cytophagia bacterium CHB2]
MTTSDSWIAFDTNIYIFGIREEPKFPACAELLQKIGALHLYIPRQIIRELQKNLQPNEVHELFGLFMRYPNRVKINWHPTAPALIEKFQELGCKFGDAVVAAHLEAEGVRTLISENRHFLTEIQGLPFRILNAATAMQELSRID